jgi:hypothetical protein
VLQRSINCLLDEDRNIRRPGIKEIEAWVGRHRDRPALLVEMFQRHMLRNLSYCLADKIEKIRESALEILEAVIGVAEPPHVLTSDSVATIAKGLFSRLDKKPFPEGSEELRLRGVACLDLLLGHHAHELVPLLPELAHTLSVVLRDDNPDMKKTLPAFMAKACTCFKSRFGGYSAGIAASLAQNCCFQQNKIRRLSIEAIGPLLLCENGGGNFNIFEQALKKCSLDKIPEVKKAVLDLAADLLNRLGIAYLKTYEDKLVSLLLTGLTDPQLNQHTLALLTTCGEQRRKLELEL